MNNVTDHGFGHDPAIVVTPGLIVRHHSAEGDHEIVVRRAHRDYGFWECVFLQGPRVHGIWVRSTAEILADAYAA